MKYHAPRAHDGYQLDEILQQIQRVDTSEILGVYFFKNTENGYFVVVWRERA